MHSQTVSLYNLFHRYAHLISLLKAKPFLHLDNITQIADELREMEGKEMIGAIGGELKEAIRDVREKVEQVRGFREKSRRVEGQEVMKWKHYYMAFI